MESTRPIRALVRGLEALAVLNLRNGATVSEVAHDIHLPRTTVYRILETLCESGFLFRDAVDDRYRLTAAVKGLSDGFMDEPWVREVAEPVVQEFGRETVWPLTLATPAGGSMMIRISTDHASPLATERHSPGCRQPLLTSASGRLYLACCTEAERRALLQVAAQSSAPEAGLARNAAQLERIFAEVREQGYATAASSRRASDDLGIAVAVDGDGRLVASLSIRVAVSAMPGKTAVERFLPRLRECAARIATRLTERGRLTGAGAAG